MGTDKMLCECAGKPLVRWAVRSVRDTLAGRVFLIANERNREAIGLVTAGDDLEILTQPPGAYGSATALTALLPVLSRYEGSLLVVDGDLPFITPETLRRLTTRHSADALDATVGAFVPSPPDNPQEFRSIGTLREVLVSVEDGPVCLVGAACFRWPVLRAQLVAQQGAPSAERSVATVPEHLHACGGRVGVVVIEDVLQHRSVNTPAQLEFARAFLSERRRDAL